METVQIIVVLAKGAKKQDGQYLDIDDEVKARIKEAIVQTEIFDSTTQQLWGFGAGTDVLHRLGPTLGMLMEKYLNQQNSRLVSFSNEYEKNFYGTLEEIQWIVNQVEMNFDPDEVEFVFFTQRSHMHRVRLIWRLFHEEKFGEAKFVPLPHAEEIPLKHEFIATLRVYGVYFGLLKPRYQTSYPED